MIHKLILKNFKKIREQTFEFNNFDLIVGANNSGKSTALQALAIWQYCVDQFHTYQKTGGRGIQIVLPSFTVLPLPEFNLLWTDKVDRVYGSNGKKKTQTYIYIEIVVFWRDTQGVENHFGVQMRYQSPQTAYVIPMEGWAKFRELEKNASMPRIVYVPPFSGLDPNEKWLDDGNVKEQVGKAQPGSILRNLLYRVIDNPESLVEQNWVEIQNRIKEWFGVDILQPQYEKKVGTKIIANYKHHDKVFDIISGGSGFHQILTLLAFFYGYKGLTTILFDEPDAHLHVNLQRKIINYFRGKNDIQFLIATHSEEFIRGVDMNSILSVIADGRPNRVESSERIIKALSDVDNIDVVRTQDNPYILYVEGEDDDRILSSWSSVIHCAELYQCFYPYIMGGGTKKEMVDRSKIHFTALKQFNRNLKRLVVLDYDTEESFHPEPENSTLFEWKRKNIDNYLLVPNAWKRAVAIELNEPEDSLFLQPYYDVIDRFFVSQNLTLPVGQAWNNIMANIFEVVDGKKILFEAKNSLFHTLNAMDGGVKISRVVVASAMHKDEIHNDVIDFFDKLKSIII